MLVPIQDPVRQYNTLQNEINSAVQSVLKSGRWLFGEQVNSFENDFARYLGARHAISVANGTDAIELALLAVNSKGKEVITVANAGGYTTTACRIIGAIPVYVDVDPDSLLISTPAIQPAITAQTAAIVVTHLYGRIADVHSIRKLLNSVGRQDIMIIEDCAQAHGGKSLDVMAGSIGDLSTFSFYPTKNLGAMGDGGAVVCQNESIAKQVKYLRQYGWQQRYDCITPYGRNSRMSEIQAAILRIKLNHLDSWNKRRRYIISQFKKAVPPPFSIWHKNSEDFVGHLAIVRHPERDRVRDKLKKMGVATDIHYPILDCDQHGQQGLPMSTHDLHVSQKATAEIFTLPCYPEMSEEEVSFICECLLKLR